MNNVTSIENLEYEEAAEFDISFRQHLDLFRRKLVLTLNVIYLLLRELFLGIKNLFLPSKIKNVSGQLCLVTGGANGLGRHLAMRFAEDGCNIAIVDIVNSDFTVNEIIQKYKVKCQGFNCDVSDNDSIVELKKLVEASMGTVDILVNNAGVLFMAPFLHCTMENIQKCVDVNLVSHFKVE